jgi:hypothetical protein
VDRVLSDLEGEELAAMADYIRQNRPDLADEVDDILGESEPAPQPEPTPEDPQAAADRALLQSVIDGTVADILSPALADELIELYERHGGEDAEWADPELKRLAEAAMDAYEKAAMEAPVPTL